MVAYVWNTGSGIFSTGSNWTPAGPPGLADTANFVASTGTISGTGAVNLLNFQAGGNWSLAGQVQAGAINDLDNVTVLSGAVLTATNGALAIGNSTTAGSLTINAGGRVLSTQVAQTTSYGIAIGSSVGAVGTVTVSGAGAVLDIGNNPASIGLSGTGTLNVTSGGTARFASSNSDLIVGLAVARSAGSVGTITVSGAGSSVVATGYGYVGRAGTGTLNINNGGSLTAGSVGSTSATTYGLTIGDGSPLLDGTGAPITPAAFSGTGTATVSGAGSVLHSLSFLRIGNRGGTGSLTVDSSATARADGTVEIGFGTDRAGGTGTAIVQGGGTLISGGTHTLASAGVVLGRDVGTTGTVTVSGSGSTLSANGDRLTVGGAGAGTLTIVSGGRAVAGSAGYSDVEAALSVAGGAGSSGTISVSGAGSQLVASGDGVIGGNETGAGPTLGGSGRVSVSGGGTLSVSGTLTIQASGTLTVDAGSTLTTPRMTINGGTANLGVLSSGNAVTFGTGGTLAITTVSGASTVSNFTFGDTIDIAGSASVSGSVVSTSTGTLTLGAAPANTTYQLFDDGHGGQLVALTPKTIGVYRFFDTSLGTHFYTSDANEAASVLATRPDLLPEGTGGIGLQAVAVQASDPNAVSVYRFFDTVHGTHFFTASASERDSIIATRSDLTYEASSSFYEHAVAQPGDTPVYRFFDNVYGTHFYTDSESERAGIVANRPDLVAEGVGFYEPKQNYMT